MRVKEITKHIKKEFFAAETGDEIFVLSNSGNEYSVLFGKGLYMFRRLSEGEYRIIRKAPLGAWRLETSDQKSAAVYESEIIGFTPAKIAETIINEIRRLELIC